MSILRLSCTNSLSDGSPPQTHSSIKGPSSNRREREGKEKKTERGRKAKEEKGERGVMEGPVKSVKPMARKV